MTMIVGDESPKPPLSSTIEPTTKTKNQKSIQNLDKTTVEKKQKTKLPALKM